MNKDNGPWLLIDVSYMCHRNFYAMGKLSHDDIGTGAVYGLLRDVVSLQDTFDTRRVVFCFDRGRSLRIREFPDYKKHRRQPVSDDDQLLRQELRRQIFKLRREYLREIGYRNILSQHGYEADDVIASVCNTIIQRKEEGIIVGRDKDLFQLISHRISMFDPQTHKTLTMQSFQRDYGIPPLKWVEVKCIAGCSTDGVPGIKGVGEKTAIKFLRGDLKPTTNGFKSIVSGNAIWERNRSLIALPYTGVKTFELLEDEITEQSWRRFAKRFGMRSMMKQAPLGSREVRRKGLKKKGA